MDEKHKDLRRKMHKLKIFEKDIKEKFIHASGPGGQNVNKVATCVTLVHAPSGTQVKCQKARTQQLNRYYARYALLHKIERQQHLRHMQEQKKREKIKRQTRKRPRALKEFILREKKKKSEKKISRRKIMDEI